MHSGIGKGAPLDVSLCKAPCLGPATHAQQLAPHVHGHRQRTAGECSRRAGWCTHTAAPWSSGLPGTRHQAPGLCPVGDPHLATQVPSLGPRGLGPAGVEIYLLMSVLWGSRREAGRDSRATDPNSGTILMAGRRCASPQNRTVQLAFSPAEALCLPACVAPTHTHTPTHSPKHGHPACCGVAAASIHQHPAGAMEASGQRRCVREPYTCRRWAVHVGVRGGLPAAGWLLAAAAAQEDGLCRSLAPPHRVHGPRHRYAAGASWQCRTPLAGVTNQSMPDRLAEAEEQQQGCWCTGLNWSSRWWSFARGTLPTPDWA